MPRTQTPQPAARPGWALAWRWPACALLFVGWALPRHVWQRWRAARLPETHPGHWLSRPPSGKH